MKRFSFMSLVLASCFLAQQGIASVKPTPTPATQDTSIERMKLENERMKLENDRLKLQIERAKLKQDKDAAAPKKETEGEEPIVVSSPRKYVGMELGRLRADASEQAQSLAESSKDDLTRVVFDFINGELWYKGVRASMNDFSELIKREGWKSKKNTEKRNAHGEARVCTSHQNLSSLKYEMQNRGVFAWSAPTEDGDFVFDTPEGLSNDASYDDFRNKFESPYFTYDKSRTKNGLTWLCFKHRVDFKEWNEKLQFGFDKDGKLAKIVWGILDEN